MAHTGYIRIKRSGNKAQLLVLIRHPMESGLRIDEKTLRRVPAHFVQELSVFHNDKRIVTGQLGTGVSANPFVALSIRNVGANDILQVSWRDNWGITGLLTAKAE